MTGVELIAQERQRQIDAEGFAAAHDDGEHGGSMALAHAAACYAEAHSMPALFHDGGVPPISPPRWPFERAAWKPRSKLENLVRAGALIAAQIDMILRENER